MWVDCNTHLERLEQSLPSLDEQFKRDGQCVIWTGIEPSQWQAMLPHSRIHCAYGAHPLVETLPADWEQRLYDYLRQNPKAPVGEIGLDGRVQSPPLSHQVARFETQLMLAKALDRAVIVHAVKSDRAVLDALKRTKTERFVIHAFSGSSEVAEAYLALGGYLSFGGLITRRPAPRILKSIGRIPQSRILLETDAPDLPMAGCTTGHPSHLKTIGEQMAHLIGISGPDWASQTTANASALFAVDFAQSD